MTLPQDISKLQSEMNAVVREHWKAFLIEGILLVILGLAAMIVPPLASLAVTIFLGWMFLISGLAGCNRFSGSYRRDGDSLVAGPLAATRMACAGPGMAHERRVQALLQGPVAIADPNEDDTMVLTGGGGTIRLQQVLN